MATVVCEVILVSIINVTFLSGFRREALKRALNPKQGTSEISQATRARWIIHSKLTMCCHVCGELRHMQSCTSVYLYVSCTYVYLHVGLLFFGFFWSYEDFSCNAKCHYIRKKRQSYVLIIRKKYQLMEMILNIFKPPIYNLGTLL